MHNEVMPVAPDGLPFPLLNLAHHTVAVSKQPLPTLNGGDVLS